MAAERNLPLRFNLMVSCSDPSMYCGDDFERIQGAGDGRLNVQSVKLFADGALGSRGAALLEEYSDQPGWTGLMLMEEGKWEGVIREWFEKVRFHSKLSAGMSSPKAYADDRRVGR